jgi:hypothetical protein
MEEPLWLPEEEEEEPGAALLGFLISIFVSSRLFISHYITPSFKKSLSDSSYSFFFKY